MERNILGDGIDAVEFRDREAVFKGTDYLLECGHKNILFLRESLKSTTRDERTRGFLLALEEHGINTMMQIFQTLISNPELITVFWKYKRQ